MTAPTEPFRLRVLKEITARLQTIERVTIDAPLYTWSLAPDTEWTDGKVLRGRAAYGDNDPLPMLGILEDPRMLEELFGPAQSTAGMPEWRIIIQGFFEDDPIHPTDPGYFLAADAAAVIAAARTEKYDILGFGGKKPCVEDIKVHPPVVRPADNIISAKAYFWLPVSLSLAEDLSNAFT